MNEQDDCKSLLEEIEILRAGLAAADEDLGDMRRTCEIEVAHNARLRASVRALQEELAAERASATHLRDEIVALANAAEAKADAYDAASQTPAKNDDDRRTALGRLVAAMVLCDQAQALRALLTSAQAESGTAERDGEKKPMTFKQEWDALTETQRKFYRHKAHWERMSLSAVMKEWPTTDAEAQQFLQPARTLPTDPASREPF